MLSASLKGLAKRLLSKDSLGLLIMTGVVSTVVDRSFKAWDESHDRQKTVISQFSAASKGFDTLVGFYVQGIVDKNEVDAAARDKIEENLIQQRQDAEDILVRSPSNNRVYLQDYITALEAMHDVLPQSTDVLHMRQFWRKASDIVSQRTRLLRKLDA